MLNHLYDKVDAMPGYITARNPAKDRGDLTSEIDKMKATHKLAALTAIIALPAAAENPVPTGMLPRTVVPSEYRLDLTIAPDQPRFSGHTAIDVTLESATSSIWIHGRGLQVQRVVARAGGKTIAGTYTQRHDEGVASLDFEQPCPRAKRPWRSTSNVPADSPAPDLNRILDEGYNRSQIVDTTLYLTDRNGIASPILNAAGDELEKEARRLLAQQ